MSARHGTPPRVARLLIRALLPRREADHLADDLRREFEAFQMPERGPAAARRWYWRQVLPAVTRLAPRAWTRLGRETATDAIRDVRHGARRLARTPTFTVVAVLTLALGVGANSAIFSVVHSVVLSPLPYDGAERILRAWDHQVDGDIVDFSFRYAEYELLARRDGPFEAVGVEFPTERTVVLDGSEALQVEGRMISSDFFDVFATEPALGRTFTRAEVESAEARLVVVTHDFWMRRLGGDPGAVGRSIQIAGVPFTLVGVLPEAYRHVSGDDVEFFVPYTLGTRRWIAHWLDLYVRLEPGRTALDARAEIDAVIDQIALEDGRSEGWFATVEPVHEMVVGDVATAVWVVFATAGLVLLIACVNVANLHLASAGARRAEMAMRRALGASGGRLTRQLLVESGLVALLGGAAGIVLAAAVLEAVQGLATGHVPRLEEATLNGAALTFSLGLVALTAVVFGLAPSLARRLEGSRRGNEALGRLLSRLVVGQVALSLALLVGAGLMVRTFSELQRQHLGFEPEGALSFRVSVPSARYPTAEDVLDFYGRLEARISALPGVTAVGSGTDLPVSGSGAVWSGLLSEDAVRAGGAREGATALQRRATSGFFEALGTRLLEGRTFRPDDADRLVWVVSESLAERLFPDGRAVGRRIALNEDPTVDEFATVIGVVEDVRYRRVDVLRDPQLYQWHRQSTTRDMAVVVRTEGDPASLLEPIRAALRELDPLVPMYRAGTLEGLVHETLGPRRFTMALFGAFALVALVLTLGGVYGVLTFAVGQRRRELGVRMALGAESAAMLALFLKRGVTLVAAGVALGGVLVLVSVRLMERLLYQVSPFEPEVYVAGATLLVVTGVLAAFVPARRAARTDPAEVLRQA